ncbi:uncharacterized protein LOC142332600 isoform X3 [Lycorma delicatula]|uniref:uncharacterized protein LOC142332600 isoform X3 n=1 Tax=Lycorma delicatula TaxID=130591 RepID=UPI003F51454D
MITLTLLHHLCQMLTTNIFCDNMSMLRAENEIARTSLDRVASPHTIDILYDGLPIPGSPFVVNVRRGCVPQQVLGVSHPLLIF